jgi:hypothetical protein
MTLSGLSLRADVAKIVVHPPFTAAWSTVVERLVSLSLLVAVDEKARLADREEKGEALASSTLWSARVGPARVLLEEGKVNLLLRILVDYLDALVTRGDATEAGAGDDAGPLHRAFEEAATVILAAIWAYAEVLQTTELPLLAEAIALAMRLTLTTPSVSARPALALLPCRLLAALAANRAALGEGRLVPELARHGVWALLLPHLVAVASCPCEAAALRVWCAGLAGLMAGEEFALVRAGMLKGAGKGVGAPAADAAVAKLLGLDALPTGVATTADAALSLASGPGAVILGLTVDAAARRHQRPLLDFADAVTRAVKR